MIEGLGELHATYAEIAAFLGVGIRTIERRMVEDQDVRDAYDRGKAQGKLSVRRKQLQAAKGGDKTMMIWLGKQWLGQKDKQEVERTGQADTSVQIVNSCDLTKLSTDELDGLLRAAKKATEPG